MAISKLGEVPDRVADFQVRLEAALAAFEAASRVTQPSVRQLEELRGTLAGLTADVKVLLDDLGVIDELDYAFVVDAVRSIQLWTWRRQTRTALLRLAGSLYDLSVQAALLSGGDKARVVTTRDGDTWQRIAQRELGDWRAWPRLVAANPGIPVASLASGTSLVVPART